MAAVTACSPSPWQLVPASSSSSHAECGKARSAWEAPSCCGWCARSGNSEVSQCWRSSCGHLKRPSASTTQEHDTWLKNWPAAVLAEGPFSVLFWPSSALLLHQNRAQPWCAQPWCARILLGSTLLHPCCGFLRNSLHPDPLGINSSQN